MIIELCLATAIFFEARNQHIDGQMAVAEVIINRVESPKWPNTICEVVNQPKQFSFTHDGLSDNPIKYNEPAAWIAAQIVAQDAISKINTLGLNSTHYHTINVHPMWRYNLVQDGVIEDHVFYSKKE